MWTNIKPSFSHLRIFGETCFVVTEPIDRLRAGSSKLADRAVRGKFFGYCDDSKGYRILLPNGKILKSTYYNTTFLSPLTEIAAVDNGKNISAPAQYVETNLPPTINPVTDSDSSSQGSNSDSDDSYHVPPSISDDDDEMPNAAINEP